MNYTKGEWKYIPESKDYIDKNMEESYRGVIQGGKLNMALAVMISDCIQDEVEANAHLIAAAVNACASVNPDNPLAVAESVKDM
jgi:hypothetical protein